MPTYVITAPDGTKYKVSGPGTEQEALAQVQAQHGQPPAAPAQPPPPAGPGYGEDMLRSIPSGLRGGVESLIGGIGSTNQLTGDLAAKGVGYLGAGPQMQEFIRNVGRRANLMPFAPSTDEIAGGTDAAMAAIPGSQDIQAATRYQPKTLPGKIAHTTAEILPSMLAGPGGVGRKVVQTGVSAAASELAGYETEGTKLEPWARVAGAVFGGGATAARNPKIPRNMTEDVLATMTKNKEDAYALSEKAGVIIKPAGMKHLADKVEADLSDFGYDPTLHPGAAVVLKKIAEKQGLDHGNTVSISNLLRSAPRLKLAEDDIAKGFHTSNTGPIQISKSPDGQLLVVDGYHRLAEATQAGKANIAVEHVPWTDTFSRVLANEKGHFIEPGITLKGLDTIRKTAGNAYIMGNKSNNAAVARIVQHIDDLIKSNDPAHMAGLDTAVGTNAIKIAREFAHRSFKLEKALNLVKKGNQNADRNITDTRVKSVKEQLAKINDPFRSWGRGFNAAEKEAAGKAARYTTPQRMLHGASVLNPAAGGKLSAAGHIAMAGTNLMSGNILGLGLQAAGIGAGVGFQKAAEHLAAKSVNEFVDLVSRGGVPAPVVKNSLKLLPPLRRAVIIRALAAAGGQQARQPLAVGSPSGQ